MFQNNCKLLFFLLLFLPVACTSLPKMEVIEGKRVYKDSTKKDLEKENFIYGYIYDSQSKQAIPGALVEIKNANLGVGYYKLKTDINGYYFVKNFIPYIKYNIEVAKDGYVNYLSAATLRPGRTNLYLEREGILQGTVKDSRGRPMSNVQIVLKRSSYYYGHGSQKPVIKFSDKGGNYFFNKLKSSAYLLSFEKSGFIKESVRIKKIKKAETFSLPMVMIRPASISGRIKIAKILIPAMAVNVTLKGRKTLSVTTYQDGSYLVDDIKPGNYKISLSHRGFYKIETKVIEIKEGEVLKGYDFLVKPKPPKISLYAYRYTFTPGMKLQFNLRTFRLEKYQVKIYQVPVEILMQAGTEPALINQSLKGFKEIDSWEESVKNFRAFAWRYQSLSISKALATGAYCMEVTGARQTLDRKFFTITSTGIVVKRSPKSILVYATNLITDQPLVNARIIIFDNTPKIKRYRSSASVYKSINRIEDLSYKILAKGKTGKNGLLQLNFPSFKHITVFAIGNDGSYAFANTGSPSDFQKEINKYFVYTDRPVYRAGNVVHYKIIGKKRGKKFQPLAGETLYYKIQNIDFNKTLDEGSFKLDKWGSFHNKIELSSGSRLGEHTIRVGSHPKRLYGMGKFYLEQYRKPEFKIDITASRDYYINGDKATFKIEAKYFFGAPLKAENVRFRFYETKLRDTDTLYWWEKDYSPARSYYRIKLEGEKYLDKNGIAVVSLHVGNYPYDRKLTLEVTITDKSNVSITSRKSVKVGRGEFYIKIRPGKNFFQDIEKNKKIKITTLTHTGKPVSVNCKVELFRFIWKSWQRVYVHSKRPVFARNIRTNEKGEFELRLPDNFYTHGEFDLVITGRDRRDNLITASRIIWIYTGTGGRVSSRFNNLELSLNKNVLQKPGKITALVKSRFADSFVLLTLEGKDIYEKKVVKLNGNILPVDFQIKKHYAPNLFIVATMQRKRALFTAIKGVSLPILDTTLKYKIVPDKKKYSPGERVKIKIYVHNENNSPVKADLSLGVVDEAIYQIRRDHTPGMKNFFYAKISNWVMTQYSYPITILAGAGKEGKIKIRAKFKDTAFWKANIKTDSQGLAEVAFKLPDNLTTWRLTIRGHDLLGRMGEKKAELKVTQELIARIGKPRFFIERDKVSLIGIVNSNTRRGLEKVSLEMRVDNVLKFPEEKIRISLPAFGSARAFYPISITDGVESVKLLFKAFADKNAKDRLLLKIPVQSRGVKYTLFGMGDMGYNKKVHLRAITETDDYIFKPEELIIRLNPSPIIKMVNATKFLTAYPYGCVEQTINRFLPILALKDFLNIKGMGSLIKVKNLSAKARAGIRRITNFQNTDGSWGWWAGDLGNEFLTGYAMFALHKIQALGFKVAGKSLAKGLTAINRMIRNRNSIEQDALYYLLYVYSVYGRWNEKVFQELVNKKSPNSYQLAFLIKTMVNGGKIPFLKPKRKVKIKQLIPRFISRLKLLFKKDNKGIYWPSVKGQKWGWPGGKAEISAHVLSALVKTKDRSALTSQLVSAITKRGRGSAWNSTKETAAVLFALGDYLKEIETPLTGSGNIDFYLNDRKISNISYNLKNMKKFATLTSLIKKVKFNRGEKVKQSYIITARGESGADVSFDLSLVGNLYFKKKGLLSFFKSQQQSLEALQNGLSLYRSFHSLTRVRDLNYNEYLVPQKFSQNSLLKVGDEIMVKIKFTAAADFEYLVLEDFLASGFEVIKKNAYGEYQPYSHIERWDNRMVFFFNKLKKGKAYEIAYIIRAELPGSFLVKPAKMECMYEPSIQGWSKPARFRVEKAR